MRAAQTFKKKVFLVTKNGLLSCNKISRALTTAPIYRPTRRNHITTEHKRLVVKVLSTLLCLPGSKPRHRTTRPVRGQRSKKEKYTREKGGQGEGPRTVERLGLSQAGTMNREPKYDCRGHTAKYRSCRRLVSLIQGCISRCPYEVPVDREGVPKQFHFRHMVYLVWFVVQLVEWRQHRIFADLTKTICRTS